MGRRNLICRCKEKSVILTNVHLHRSSTECRMIHHFSDLPEKASKCWPPWWKLHWWEVNLSTLDKNKIKIIVFVGYGVLKTFDKKMIPPEGCSNDASHRLSDQQIFVLWTNALLQSPWFRIWNCEMWNGVLGQIFSKNIRVIYKLSVKKQETGQKTGKNPPKRRFYRQQCCNFCGIP